MENGEIAEGLASVAVAVKDRTGWPVTSLAVTYPAGGPDESRLVAEVHRYAELLQRRLYG